LGSVQSFHSTILKA